MVSVSARAGVPGVLSAIPFAVYAPSCALRRAPHPHPAHPINNKATVGSIGNTHTHTHTAARARARRGAWSVENGAMHRAVNAARCALRRAPHPHPAHPRQPIVHSQLSTVHTHTHTHTHTAAPARARERRGPAHRTRYLAYCPHPRAKFGTMCVCSLCTRTDDRACEQTGEALARVQAITSYRCTPRATSAAAHGSDRAVEQTRGIATRFAMDTRQN